MNYRNNYSSLVFRCIFTVASLMCLASCAQTVHIHPGQLPDNLIQQLQSNLEGEGFRYHIQSNKHPSPEMGNLLIYYPDKKSTEKLDILLSILKSMDIPIDSIVADKLYKHEYTKRNYGLYFSNQDKQVKKVDISEMNFDVDITDLEFEGFECKTTLELNADTTVRFASLTTNEEESEKLSWRIKKDQEKELLLIRNGSETFQYEIISTISSDRISKTYETRLLPIGMQRLPFGCEYESFFKFTK